MSDTGNLPAVVPKMGIAFDAAAQWDTGNPTRFAEDYWTPAVRIDERRCIPLTEMKATSAVKEGLAIAGCAMLYVAFEAAPLLVAFALVHWLFLRFV